MPSAERGQASVELVALVALVLLGLGGLLHGLPAPDGRTLGGFLAHHLACAATGGCRAAEAKLVAAYGERGAALVRAHAPNLVFEPGERQLPVDWRSCRRAGCAEAPDDGALDAHLGGGGRGVHGAGGGGSRRATAFTRLVRRGGRVHVQYWLYYPDSNTTLAGADRAWERSWILPRVRELIDGSRDWPGFHRDDWESVQVRLDPDGSAWVRVSSHGRYQHCKGCEGWGRAGGRGGAAGWVRVSRGSHANHVPPERAPGERTTTGEGLRLIPLETHDRRGYRALDDGVRPPWRKGVYADPESDAA